MFTKSKSNKYINLSTLLIIVVALLLPAMIFFGVEIKTWVVESYKLNSLLAMMAVFICSNYSIHRFSTFSQSQGFRYILFGFFFWVGFIFSGLAIFHLNYSVYYLVTSTSLILAVFLFFSYLENRYKKITIAYIPQERPNTHRFDHLPQRKNMYWQKIESPQEFNSKKMKIVMADFRAELSDEWLKFLTDCALKQIPVYHSNRLLEILTGRVKIDHLTENELGSLLPSKNYQIIKRFLEIFLILISLPVTLPIMLITALLIAVESRGGVFFIQKRVGQGNQLFNMYKFRSMYVDTANDKTTTDNDERITRVGKFIRKTRIDELPQFYNVLRGEMSLIGPRAEFDKFVKDYEKEIPFYSYRHIVKPGISGWAQVEQGYNFGVEASKEKLEYDFYYIKNYSFSLDLLILFKTIQTMLTGFGAK